MIRIPISVQVTRSHIAKYRTLLLAPWNRSFPDRVLELLSDFKADVPEWIRSTTPCPLPNDFAKMLDHLRWSVGRLRMDNMPALPDSYENGGRLPKSAWQALRIAGYLLLQSTHEIQNVVDFFRDLQSLAFQAAMDVLHRLASRKDERAILLHAMALFPLEYAADDPGQYSYLMSQVHDALGNDAERLKCLEASFRFTSPKDHSYLTKAQQVWSELLDQNRNEEAKRFLFELQRNCLPTQVEEVQAMTVDALKYMMASHPN